MPPSTSTDVAERRRRPDMKDLPDWLSRPVRQLVRSRGTIALQPDGRGRLQFDWDAAACMYLTQEYWDEPNAARPGWLSCVLLWSAARPQGDFSLVPNLQDLARSVVTLVVAETIAHQNNISLSEVDVRMRRHINTTAGRQREYADFKLTLAHVVHLALARFDFDVLFNKLAHPSTDALLLEAYMLDTFATLHLASRTALLESADLRAAVVELTSRLRAFVGASLFIPWHDVLQLPSSSNFEIEFAARAFVSGLPRPDLALFTMNPPAVDSVAFFLWIEHLCQPEYFSRWDALTRFLHGIFCEVSDERQEEVRTAAANVIVSLLLHAAAGKNFPQLADGIKIFAAAHARRSRIIGAPPVFRDLLEKALDLALAKDPSAFHDSSHAACPMPFPV